MTPRRVVAGYLILQAIGIAAWWCLLVLHPLSIAWFQPAGWPKETLLGFWLADLVLLCSGSALTAFAVLRALPWAPTAIGALTVAAAYPTLYCLGVSLLTGQAWLASAMMAVMAGLTLAMATIYGTGQQAPAAIRVTPLGRSAALFWTGTQIVVFWGVFLGILPLGIVELEQHWGGPRLVHAGQSIAALTLFAAASGLGLWSGVAMAMSGEGTPLPTATAPKLVVSGPYRFVRNPMALAGILQGVAVGWWLGSWGVLAYALAGAAVWHGCVRPIEEADLRRRFGSDYEQYQSSVRLWIPVRSARVK